MPSFVDYAIGVFLFIGWLSLSATTIVLTIGLAFEQKRWVKYAVVAAAFLEFYIAVMVPVTLGFIVKGSPPW